MPELLPDAGAIRFRKHRDAGSVLNATLAFVRENARELLTSYLALVAPVALASGLAIALYFRQFGDVFADPEALVRGDVQMSGVSYLGVLVFGMLGTALAQAAGAGYVRLYRQGEAGSITAGRLWEASRGLLLPFLGLPVVFAVVVMLAAVISIVPCLGALAWVGFVVWLLPYYAVTLAVRALDEDSLVAAWTRARTLVKGSWAFAAGALLLAFLVVMVVSFGVMMVFSAVMGVAMAGSMTGDPAQTMTWMGAVMAPLQVVSYALYAVMVVAMFFVHGRLAEELDGSALGDQLDDLDGLSGFDAPTGSASAEAQPARSPFAAAPPPLASTPPAGSAGPTDGAPPADTPPSDEQGGAGRSGFRGGGFDA